MYQSLAFAVALVGSSIAAVWDLKTTEVPDKIPYIMSIIGLAIYGAQSFLAQNPWILINSIVAGSLLFAFGFILYRLGQWGGADAKLLAAIGFLLPSVSELGSISTFAKFGLIFPFPFTYVANLFLIGTVYMLVYATVITIMNRKVIFAFKKDVKASSRIFFVISVVLLVFFASVNWMLYSRLGVKPTVNMVLISSVMPILGTTLIFMIWKFARAVENVGFRKRIPVRKLREGDILLSSKLWEGVTASEVRKIKYSGKKHIWIKEGVRFIPAFPLALLFTFYYGDAILMMFRYLL